ncbi:MAG TPA: hypothetical protein PKD24_15600 [Pyrinomonadaceae bacterium]|nr:hypothetical protein [Pyrinomonadaceae bacterium]HMP66276.1 hypothetical protein [Pyrinomonadaceae bacterium]
MIRNIIAVVAGLVVGAVVNTGIVILGPMIVTPPPGVDMTTAEGITAALPLLEPRHFAPPFLAHALGTLVGALVAALISAASKMTVAMIVGCFTLIGGIIAATMIPAPMWFIALDLIVAYIPMAYVGGKIGSAIRPA